MTFNTWPEAPKGADIGRNADIHLAVEILAEALHPVVEGAVVGPDRELVDVLGVVEEEEPAGGRAEPAEFSEDVVAVERG